MKHFRLVAGTWTLLLIAGFAVIFLLGGAVASSTEELEAAYHPKPPVSQQAAEASADTIVRIQYASFLGVPRAVRQAQDFGIDHWVIEYTDRTGSAPRGLRISIGVTSGQVEVNSFP